MDGVTRVEGGFWRVLQVYAKLMGAEAGLVYPRLQTQRMGIGTRICESPRMGSRKQPTQHRDASTCDRCDRAALRVVTQH
jgi:hypothetical protein